MPKHKQTRQGVRDLNGPNMDGQNHNGHRKQHISAGPTEMCLHVDIKHYLFEMQCKTCGKTWDRSTGAEL